MDFCSIVHYKWTLHFFLFPFPYHSTSIVGGHFPAILTLLFVYYSPLIPSFPFIVWLGKIIALNFRNMEKHSTFFMLLYAIILICLGCLIVILCIRTQLGGDKRSVFIFIYILLRTKFIIFQWFSHIRHTIWGCNLVVSSQKKVSGRGKIVRPQP